MWTCDVIKALKKIEERKGMPICFHRIVQDPYSKVLKFYDENYLIYEYDIEDDILTRRRDIEWNNIT